jgi:hypothetical protein
MEQSTVIRGVSSQRDINAEGATAIIGRTHEYSLGVPA